MRRTEGYIRFKVHNDERSALLLLERFRAGAVTHAAPSQTKRHLSAQHREGGGSEEALEEVLEFT